MVGAVSTDVPQGQVLAAVHEPVPEYQVPLARGIAAFRFPTEEEQISQAQVLVLPASNNNNVYDVAQARTLVLVRGRIASPKLRAWTFTLDGHDFYVLRLGDTVSLVYDTATEQWQEWSSKDLSFWRANVGTNWLGASNASDVALNYGSNIIVGDDTFGLLWLLDPTLGIDQHPDQSVDADLAFTRITMGQVSVRGRAPVPCNVVYLTADLGAPAFDGAGITLYTSDDAGHNFTEQNTITVAAADYTQELAWRSLGDITAPGRLFKLVDDGAVARIDGLEMNDGG